METESRDDRKSRDVVYVLGVLVVVFALATATLFIEMQNLRGLNANLKSQANSLNLTHQADVAELENLKAQYATYVSTHQHSNAEYSNYVSNHLYSNAEYDEARFDFYYSKPENQKFGVYDLDDELNGLQWSEPYQAGIFDCSEMSACLEWHLENRGWHTKIYVGDFPEGRHAWLIVETSEGAYMPVESTSLRLVWWSDSDFDNYWEYDQRFETIQDALSYSESSYDWWNLGFYPFES